MEPTTIIGIDCACADANVGLALGVSDATGCTVRHAGACPGERTLAEEIARHLHDAPRILLALDAPLGWPRAMGQLLAAHEAGAPLGIPANTMFRRETDRFIRVRLGKQSLDVGADRIARTTHAALGLLEDLRRRLGQPLPLAWTPGYRGGAAIEVYPAALLIAYGIPTRGYKKPEATAARGVILERLQDLVRLPAQRTAMELSAHVLDAALCVLAGDDFLRGRCYEPEDGPLARQEGWAWVRDAAKP